MQVTLVGASWDVVAGDQTGVDFIPMKFCGVPSCLALGVGATIAAYHPPAGEGSICQRPWVGRRAQVTGQWVNRTFGRDRRAAEAARRVAG